jgi:small subunit ribosomal protein S11
MKKRRFARSHQSFAVVRIQTSLNNTTLTLTTEGGRVLAWTSAGSAGFKGSRRSTSYAAQGAGELLAQKSLSLGYSGCFVRLKGIGYGKEAAVRGLKLKGVQVKRIDDLTPVPHNGCRPPKKRKV